MGRIVNHREANSPFAQASVAFSTQLHTKLNGEPIRISVATESFLLGREATCDLRVWSPAVSRKHCILVSTADSLVVIDLGSRNGTFVNERRLRLGESAELRHRTRLQVGHVEFVIVRKKLQAGFASTSKSEELIRSVSEFSTAS